MSALELVKDPQDLQGVIDATIEISRRRADTLREIKRLALDGEKEAAWNLLLKHLGIEGLVK